MTERIDSRAVQRRTENSSRNLPSTERAPDRMRTVDDGLTETDRRRLRTAGGISSGAAALFCLVGLYYVILGMFMTGVIVFLIGAALGYMGLSMLKRARG